MRTGILTGAALSLLLASAAQAALLERLDGQAYYDTVLDISWLADANLAASNTFGITGINVDGTMSWPKANEWIAAMNVANYLGLNDWRLPVIIDTGTPACNFAYTGTDCGYNVQTKSTPVSAYQTGQTVYSEMAHLYYSTLGNVGYSDTSGNPTGGACTIAANHCLTRTGPFSNLQPDVYWSGTVSATIPVDAWLFNFGYGGQALSLQGSPFYAWAVRNGDVIPVPAAMWLFGSALGVLGVARRRKAPDGEA